MTLYSLCVALRSHVRNLTHTTPLIPHNTTNLQYNACRYIINALILLAIIITLNFTITQLNAMLAASPWDPSTPYYYARTRQLQTFRVGFVCYLVLPTCFLLVRYSNIQIQCIRMLVRSCVRVFVFLMF